jgi:hypothetical protein
MAAPLGIIAPELAPWVSVVRWGKRLRLIVVNSRRFLRPVWVPVPGAERRLDGVRPTGYFPSEQGILDGVVVSASKFVELRH